MIGGVNCSDEGTDEGLVERRCVLVTIFSQFQRAHSNEWAGKKRKKTGRTSGSGVKARKVSMKETRKTFALCIFVGGIANHLSRDESDEP